MVAHVQVHRINQPPLMLVGHTSASERPRPSWATTALRQWRYQDAIPRDCMRIRRSYGARNFVNALEHINRPIEETHSAGSPPCDVRRGESARYRLVAHGGCGRALARGGLWRGAVPLFLACVLGGGPAPTCCGPAAAPLYPARPTEFESIRRSDDPGTECLSRPRFRWHGNQERDARHSQTDRSRRHGRRW